ncbi:MAG: hypothetical protein AAF740_00935 [Bacteroidota bacterium]
MGAPSSALEISVGYDKEQCRKFAFLEVMEDLHLTASKGFTYDFTLVKGTKIEIFRSQQYELDTFIDLLNSVGFDVISYNQVQQGFSSAFLCKRK